MDDYKFNIGDRVIYDNIVCEVSGRTRRYDGSRALNYYTLELRSTFLDNEAPLRALEDEMILFPSSDRSRSEFDFKFKIGERVIYADEIYEVVGQSRRTTNRFTNYVDVHYHIRHPEPNSLPRLVSESRLSSIQSHILQVGDVIKRKNQNEKVLVVRQRTSNGKGIDVLHLGPPLRASCWLGFSVGDPLPSFVEFVQHVQGVNMNWESDHL